MSDYRLGKLPAFKDPRTITLRSIIKKLPPSAKEFSVDKSLGFDIPVQMLGNDTHGDCVVVDEFNHALRFECLEQNKCISVTTDDALNQYWKEQGWTPRKFLCLDASPPKPDNGLVMLDAFKYWRTKGIVIGGKTYKIYAFATALEEQEIKWCVEYLYGAEFGVALPHSAVEQFDDNEPWSVVADDGGIDGGHAIYCEEYNEVGPVVLTWARKQQCTWEWFNKYRDESYGVVPAKNVDSPDNPIDEVKLSVLLAEITA